MKLVLYYTVSDGCTYSCDVALPIEYESAESLLCDLEAAVNAYMAELASIDAAITRATAKGYTENTYTVLEPLYAAKRAMVEKFECGTDDVWLNHFIENGKFEAPTIFTVDEWFDHHKLVTFVPAPVDMEVEADVFVFDCSNCGYHEFDATPTGWTDGAGYIIMECPQCKEEQPTVLYDPEVHW